MRREEFKRSEKAYSEGVPWESSRVGHLKEEKGRKVVSRSARGRSIEVETNLIPCGDVGI